MVDGRDCLLFLGFVLLCSCAASHSKVGSAARLTSADRKARVLDARRHLDLLSSPRDPSVHLPDQSMRISASALATIDHRPSTISSSVSLLEPLLREGNDDYWSRQAVELVAGMEEALAGKGVSAAGMLLTYYSNDPRAPLASHLLFHGARLMAGTGQDKDRRLALYLLLTLIDEHSPSPLWDDAVWLAADICRDLGYRGDETRILETALLPHPGWGSDALSGRFVQKVRYRLARLYERQGRADKALREYALVINFHDGLALKDDALWRIAVVHGSRGESTLERKALMLLVDECPWSRHAPKAKERLR
jgi:hypothetical protein